MNELASYQNGLPNTIEDLSLFVLVGREKLSAVRAAIRAIDKVQLAQEVRDQKMEEARMLSEALLDAEVRLGEMTKAIPKATAGNQYTGKMVPDTAVADQYGAKATVVSKVGEFTSTLSKDTSFHGNQHVEVASRQRDISKTKGPKRGVRAVDEVAIEYANARQMESHS